MTGNDQRMTLREYFAAHAPEAVPEWFECTSLPVAPVDDRVPLDLLLPEHQDAARKWAELPVGTLIDFVWRHAQKNAPTAQCPPEILVTTCRRIQASYDAYHEAHQAWQWDCTAQRYFAWRWHYAAVMERMAGQQLAIVPGGKHETPAGDPGD
jgi:hypothetical protein